MTSLKPTSNFLPETGGKKQKKNQQPRLCTHVSPTYCSSPPPLHCFHHPTCFCSNPGFAKASEVSRAGEAGLRVVIWFLCLDERHKQQVSGRGHGQGREGSEPAPKITPDTRALGGGVAREGGWGEMFEGEPEKQVAPGCEISKATAGWEGGQLAPLTCKVCFPGSPRAGKGSPRRPPLIKAAGFLPHGQEGLVARRVKCPTLRRSGRLSP